jgi:hypothetical protein
LRLEEHTAGSVIFNFGDPGSYFYVVIEGSVDVRVPNQVGLEEDSATPEGLISFIIMYFSDIFWQQIPRGESVLQLLYEEIRRFGIEIDESGHFDTTQVLKAFDREISLGTSKVHNKIYKILNPSNSTTI